MKKLSLLTLALCFQLITHAQILTQWTTSTPSGFTMTAASGGIRGNSTSTYSAYANSKQKLSTCEDGYVEFNANEPQYFPPPPASGTYAHYQVGFAKASDPGVMLIGFDFVSGQTPSSPAGYLYAGASGSLFTPFAGTTAIYNSIPYSMYMETGTTPNCANPVTGTKFRIERTGGVIHFRNVTNGCELFYLSTGAFPVTPNEDWILVFKSTYTNISTSGINNCNTSFSGLCGETNLWTRINSTSIRPLALGEKVGVGKDPTANLDVQGTARFSSIMDPIPYMLVNDGNGQLSLSTLKAIDIATKADIANLPKDWEVLGNNVATGHGTGGYPSGNVGIGLTNPLERLHVSGNIRTTSLAGTVTAPVWGGNKQLFADVDGKIMAAPLDWQRLANNDLVAGYLNSGYASNNVGIGTASPIWNFKLTIDNRENQAAPNNFRNAIHATAMHTNCSFGYGILVNTNVLGGTKAIAVEGDGIERALIFGNGMSWFRNRMTIGGVCPTLGLCDENDPGETNVLTIFGSALASGGNWIPSDARFKKNIIGIEGADDLLKKLNPVSYQYKTEEFGERHFPAGMTYGFIAQELKEVLPYSVKEEQDGYYSVNYTVVIPVLVAAMKEQQQQIEELKQQMKGGQTTSPAGNTTGTDGTGNNLSIRDGYLNQNVPNPFTGNTEIKYKLPTGGHKGMMGIYDLNGKEIKLFQLNQAEGVLSVSGTELQPGIYIYTLIVDGQPYDSKKMILTSY